MPARAGRSAARRPPRRRAAPGSVPAPGEPAPPRRPPRRPPRPPFPAGRPATLLALDLPAQEALHLLPREIVGELLRRGVVVGGREPLPRSPGRPPPRAAAGA